MFEKEILDELPYISARNIEVPKGIKPNEPDKFLAVFDNHEVLGKLSTVNSLFNFLGNSIDYCNDGIADELTNYIEMYSKARYIRLANSYANLVYLKEYKVEWVETRQFNSSQDDMENYGIYIVNEAGIKAKYGIFRFRYEVEFDRNKMTSEGYANALELFKEITDTKCLLCEEKDLRIVKTVTFVNNNVTSLQKICYKCMEKYGIERCYKCGSYGLLINGYCTNCYSSSIDHRKICKSCKVVYTQKDSSEEYCNDCNRNRESNIEDVSKIIKSKTLRNVEDIFWFTKFLDTEFPQSKNERTFGLEFEINTKENFYETFTKFLKASATKKIYGYPLINYIFIKRDGSLDSKRGIEFNTCVLKGKQGIEVLKVLVLELQKYFDVDRRCGLHVHFGVKDFKEPDFKNLYFFYQRFQDYFGLYVRKDRINNSYCNPIKKLKKKDIISKSARNLTDDRYKAVNFKAIDEMNTIELRILEGTLDLEKILIWIEVNMKIINFIKREEALIYNKFVINRLLRKILGKDLFLDFLERQKYHKWLEEN